MITCHIKDNEMCKVSPKIYVVELKAINKKYPPIKNIDRQVVNNFRDFWALRNVSLEIGSGETIGIIGRNGAGKSTLMNIIARTLSPTSGINAVKGKVLGLFNLGVGFQDELTGRENIFLNSAILGSDKKETEHKLGSIINFSELGSFIDMPLGTYSQGMRLRLGFSIIVNQDFDILVIDEILAVGDTLFQNKCFQRLSEFKRAGKTLIISNQNMELVQRLCEKVILLDHGEVLFYGDSVEGINKYNLLLNMQAFFVGPVQKQKQLIENTKKWSEDKSLWGNKLGTKEVFIDKVEFLRGWGKACSSIRSKERLKIKVRFSVESEVQEPHFGVAIFRSDGAYCYGPNSLLDGIHVARLQKGRGYFELDLPKLLLAPGEYYVSVAVWDKNETLAFDYHNGCYHLKINNYNNLNHELINIPFNIANQLRGFKKTGLNNLDLEILKGEWQQGAEIETIKIGSVKILNHLNEEKDTFICQSQLKLLINFAKIENPNKNFLLWIGLYRDDGVYCQGITSVIGRKRTVRISFPKIPLLPGGYRFSLGVIDNKKHKFLIYRPDAYPFKMVSEKTDHGTVYLEHTWRWRQF